MPGDSTFALLRARHAQLERVIHVGVLVPWANTVVEAELPRLGLDKVVFHYARLVPPGRTTALDDAYIRGLWAAVPDAVEQMTELPLAGVLMACTSAGFAVPVTPPPGVTSAFDALSGALQQIGANRIVLVTPYPHPLTAREVAAFGDRGIGVACGVGLGLEDRFAEVTSVEIHALLDQIDRAVLSDVDAVVLSCTGWPTLGLIVGAEDALGVPVISSNVAMAMHAVTLTTGWGAA